MKWGCLHKATDLGYARLIHHFQRHIRNMWVWLTGSMQRMTRTMPEPNIFASVPGPTSSWRGPSVAPHTVWAYPSPTLGAWRTQSQWGSISVQKILHSALLHTATHTVHFEYYNITRYFAIGKRSTLTKGVHTESQPASNPNFWHGHSHSDRSDPCPPHSQHDT